MKSLVCIMVYVRYGYVRIFYFIFKNNYNKLCEIIIILDFKFYLVIFFLIDKKN